MSEEKTTISLEQAVSRFNDFQKNGLNTVTIEDVLTILNQIQNGYSEDVISKTLEAVLSNFEYDEFVNSEPELHGSYGDSYSLEMNTSFDDREFKRCFVMDFMGHLETEE